MDGGRWGREIISAPVDLLINSVAIGRGARVRSRFIRKCSFVLRNEVSEVCTRFDCDLDKKNEVCRYFSRDLVLMKISFGMSVIDGLGARDKSCDLSLAATRTSIATVNRAGHSELCNTSYRSDRIGRITFRTMQSVGSHRSVVARTFVS